MSLSEAAASFSFFVGTVKHQYPASIYNDDIVRWQILEHTEVLNPGSIRPERCRIPAPVDIEIASNQIALPITGGTVKVKGVMVTEVTDVSSTELNSGESYLFVGTVCPNRTGFLALGQEGIFRISTKGRFEAVSSQSRFKLAASLAQVDSVDQLRTLIK